MIEQGQRYADLDAAERFSGVSKYTLRRWIKENKLRRFSPGGKALIDLRELEQLIRSAERPGVMRNEMAAR